MTAAACHLNQSLGLTARRPENTVSTGLGLTISRLQLDLLGGDATVKVSRMKGTVFTATFQPAEFD